MNAPSALALLVVLDRAKELRDWQLCKAIINVFTKPSILFPGYLSIAQHHAQKVPTLTR